MTLVLSIQGPETIWLLADRRLSYENKPPKDDARKIMVLQANDGVAILGYAGLGATALGTEPADWMSAVLRGRKLPLEKSLGTLAEAAKKQLQPHIRQMPKGNEAHTIVAPAFIGKEVRIYTIDIVVAPDGKNLLFRFAKFADERSSLPPRIALGGTGGLYYDQHLKEKWNRPLLRLIKANDRGQVSAITVADQLAKLNQQVSESVKDKSVGPRCIVAWQHKRGGIHKIGGAHQLYTGTIRDKENLEIPTIAGEFDVAAIMRATFPIVKQKLEANMKGEHTEQLDTEAMNAALAQLPTEPDEKLR